MNAHLKVPALVGAMVAALSANLYEAPAPQQSLT